MKDKLKTIATMMTSNEGTLFTYALAYSLITGVAPFLIIIVLFVGPYVYNIEQIILFLQRYIPAELVNPFVEYLSASNLTNLWLIISLFGISIWVASKSIYSFLLQSSRHDDVDINPIFLRGLAMIYFVVIIGGLGIIVSLLSLFPLVNRYILPFIMLFFFLLFYRLLSFKKRKMKDLIYGSLFSAVVISALGRLFFNIIDQYTSYQSVYGPLASLMILLISAYIIAWVIYCGYVINYVARDTDLDNTQKNKIIQFLDNNNH